MSIDECTAASVDNDTPDAMVRGIPPVRWDATTLRAFLADASAAPPGAQVRFLCDDAAAYLGTRPGPHTWDQAAWRSLYDTSDRRQGDRLRVAVAATTLASCRAGSYPGPTAPQVLPTPPAPRCVQLPPHPPPPCFRTTRLRVVASDTLDCAMQLRRQGRVLALNLANAHQPGGGWLRGRPAQEEELFRRTALAAVLHPSLLRPGALAPYPVPEFGCIIAEQVPVFRAGPDAGYAYLDKPQCLDFAFVAAYDASTESRFSVLTPEGRLTPEAAERTSRKLACLLTTAAGRWDVLVLGALGCGAFGNPAQDIAALFLSACRAHAGHFREIHFAVLDGGRDRNFPVFCNVLTGGAAEVELCGVHAQ
eukprot:gene5834-4407_t